MLRFVPRSAHQPTKEELSALKPCEGIQARLLYARGIRDAEAADAFLHPSLSQLHDPMRLQDMDKALLLLAQAKEKRWPTVVYTDYDADGICAGSVMVTALKRYGISVGRRTPMRAEGYGLNCAAVEQLAKEYRLLITVDLGITNHKEVLLAQELGMKVIVTDHHALGLEASPADAVINPLLGDYPWPKLCGTGVAFKVAQALLGLNECRDLLDLVALATVADIVPLMDENRVLVAEGLKVMNTRQRLGLRELMSISDIKGDADSSDLGFRLGPRLNASGRLGNAADAITLLLTEDESEARTLAKMLDDLNRQRKSAESAVVAQAAKEVESFDFVENRLLIVRGEGWLPGVVGLAAGRLNEQYNCPTCVLSEMDGQLVGSLRSIPGVHIQKCLTECDDLLLRYGGHSQAAGVTLDRARYEEFQARLEKAVERCAGEEAYLPRVEYDALVRLEDCTPDLLRALKELEPFGCENPAPLLLARGAQVLSKRTCGAEDAHLQMQLAQDGRRLKAIAFRMGNLYSGLPEYVDTAFALGENTYNGQTTLQMQIHSILPDVQNTLNHLRQEENAQGAEALLTSILTMEEEKARELNASGLTHIADWEEVLAAAATAERGHLFVAQTTRSAIRLLERVPSLDFRRYTLNERRCFPTVLLNPHYDGLSCGGFMRHVWLLDGLLSPEEEALWHQRMPCAVMHLLPQSDALRQTAQALCVTDEECRGLIKVVYTLCKKGGMPGVMDAIGALARLTPAQTRCALNVFAEGGWISLRESPLIIRWTYDPQSGKGELSKVPLLRVVRRLAATNSVKGESRE